MTRIAQDAGDALKANVDKAKHLAKDVALSLKGSVDDLGSSSIPLFFLGIFAHFLCRPLHVCFEGGIVDGIQDAARPVNR